MYKDITYEFKDNLTEIFGHSISPPLSHLMAIETHIERYLNDKGLKFKSINDNKIPYTLDNSIFYMYNNSCYMMSYKLSSFQIILFKDDYFMIECFNLGERKIYLYDQLDGLTSCLNDIIIKD